MKRRAIKLSLVVLVLALFGYLGVQFAGKLRDKQEVAARLETMPDFHLETAAGAAFVRDSIAKGRPVLFVYFNSECGYCQREAELLDEHDRQLGDSQILMVSSEDWESILQFAKTYNLDLQDRIRFLRDSDQQFATRFDASSIPYLLIYDREGRLVWRNKGITSISKLIEKIEEL